MVLQMQTEMEILDSLLIRNDALKVSPNTIPTNSDARPVSHTSWFRISWDNDGIILMSENGNGTELR